MLQMTFTALYMKVPEGNVAFVEELPGADMQGETLEELRTNLEQAVSMVLEATVNCPSSRWETRRSSARA